MVEGLGQLPSPTPGKPMICIADSGDFDAGDGFRVLIGTEYAYFHLRAYERECGIAIPIQEVLDALQQLAHSAES